MGCVYVLLAINAIFNNSSIIVALCLLMEETGVIEGSYQSNAHYLAPL
jgi:hypothetical protein